MIVRSGRVADPVQAVFQPAGDAGAWAATLTLARGMAGMTGTMGLGLAAFMPLWILIDGGHDVSVGGAHGCAVRQNRAA